MAEVRPIWFFIAGLVLLFVFMVIVVPRPSNYGDLHHYEGFSSGATFYMFSVDWCPHCISTRPEFEALGSTQTIGGKTVNIVMVNPEKEPEKAAGFEISGYPTLILQKADGTKTPYSGPRKTPEFRQFLESSV